MKMLEDANARGTKESLTPPLQKKGGYIVRKGPTMCTYNYIDKQFNALVSRLISHKGSHEQQDMKSPPPLCVNFDMPN